MLLAASTFTVSGAPAWLDIIAIVCFLIAAIVAWFVAPRSHWATAVSVGLIAFVLSFVVK